MWQDALSYTFKKLVDTIIDGRESWLFLAFVISAPALIVIRAFERPIMEMFPFLNLTKVKDWYVIVTFLIPAALWPKKKKESGQLKELRTALDAIDLLEEKGLSKVDIRAKYHQFYNRLLDEIQISRGEVSSQHSDTIVP